MYRKEDVEFIKELSIGTFQLLTNNTNSTKIFQDGSRSRWTRKWYEDQHQREFKFLPCQVTSTIPFLQMRYSQDIHYSSFLFTMVCPYISFFQVRQSMHVELQTFICLCSQSWTFHDSTTTRFWHQLIFPSWFFHTFLLHPPLTHVIKSLIFFACQVGSLSYPFFSNKFDNENLSQAPLDIEMLENQFVGESSLGIIIFDCENPLGAIR